MKTLPSTPFCRALILAGTVALLPGFPARADEIKFTLKSSGAGKTLGYYMPMRAKLSADKPEGVKSAPGGLEAPLYGAIKLGPAESPTTFYVIVDEPDGKPSRLFVDPDGSGTFSAGAATGWTGSSRTNAGKVYTMYSGGADFKVPYGSAVETLHLNIYRFDKHEPSRAQIADQLFYYRDYASVGELTLGGKTYQATIANDAANGDFRGAGTNAPPVRLLVDLNDDGKYDLNGESFTVGKPFNIGGTTYELTGLSALGTSFQIVKSSQTVEETKPKVSLAAGKMALPFSAKTMTGKEVSFPQSYKGKVVLLDFWATWCGPCKAEIPNVVATYQKFHDQGFEVLSVSLDRENSADTVTKYASENKMDWPEIYDGKFWKAELAQKYYIDSIPHAFLIDGTTGRIIAEGAQARGENLPFQVEKALTVKKTLP